MGLFECELIKRDKLECNNLYYSHETNLIVINQTTLSLTKHCLIKTGISIKMNQTDGIYGWNLTRPGILLVTQTFM